MLNRYNTPLYLAIRKYGINNFSFEILEDNIDNVELLNEKEKMFIIKYTSTSHQNGYNITNGGDGGHTSCKLKEEQVFDIIKILSDKDNLQSFYDIAKIFNISVGVISNINKGELWFQPNITYPIREYDTTGLTLSREQYRKIIKDIQESPLTLQDIAKKYNLSKDQINSINYGKYCYSKENKYYKGLYNGDFPIRKNKHPKIKIDDNFQSIFYDILYSKDSIEKIGQKYNINGGALRSIVLEARRKKITKDFLTPIRENLEENKKIFQQLYPNFIKEKEGD